MKIEMKKTTPGPMSGFPYFEIKSAAIAEKMKKKLVVEARQSDRYSRFEMVNSAWMSCISRKGKKGDMISAKPMNHLDMARMTLGGRNVKGILMIMLRPQHFGNRL